MEVIKCVVGGGKKKRVWEFKKERQCSDGWAKRGQRVNQTRKKVMTVPTYLDVSFAGSEQSTERTRATREG